MKQKNFYFYTNILAWGLVLFLIGNYVFGWTTPTANPPSSNLSAPVNVSSTEQTKTGNLIIDSLLKVGRYSSAPSGSVGTPTDTDAATKGYVDAAGATCEHIARHSASQHYGNHNCDDNPINCCPTGYHMCSWYEVEFLAWIGCLDTSNLHYSGDDLDNADIDRYTSNNSNICLNWTSNSTSSSYRRYRMDGDFSLGANYGPFMDWTLDNSNADCDNDYPVWCCN